MQSTIELINFFRIVVFYYLFANGDAHLKNFALMESEQGDYLLAPAYDLLCTALHIDDGNLVLHNGLYEGDMDESTYRDHGMYTRQSFMVFAKKIGVQVAISEKIIDAALKAVLPAIDLIDRSFLSKESKEKYKDILGDRHKRLLKILHH